MTLILGLSILLQFAAAFLAWRWVRITEKQLAWSLIYPAILLMAVRGSIALYQWTFFNNIPSPDPGAEGVALMVSILMVLGLLGLSLVFKPPLHLRISF